MKSQPTSRALSTALILALTVTTGVACSQKPAAAAADAAPAPAAAAAPTAPAAVPAVDAVEAARLAEAVRTQTRHAWEGYMRYAKGHDDLKPISGQPRDWYAQSLLMSPVDALDTLVLLGLDKEANEARELIVSQLDFDRDMEVQNFEITIRLLGGLISGYQLTGDERLLKLAEDLGKRLLPVFESKTGLPYTHVNLRTGKVRGNVSNPAETGTLLIEFGALSKITGNPIYYDKAKRALVETYNRRSKIGLVGSNINVETGEWTNTGSHIAGGIDSYYEYLFKCWKLFGDTDCKQMWEQSIGPVNQYLADDVREGELWYGHADMHTGTRTQSSYGALDAFMPGLLAFGGDLERAKRLQESGLKMWRLHGIEPESLDYQKLEVRSPGYALRPEIVESAYYLHHYTGDARYQGMGKEFFEDFVKHTRTEHGFAALKDVRSKEKEDSMESFLFAETFKYYYLLFAPKTVLDFDSVVFNTEAHPIRRSWEDK
ncbi:MAG TPA: glycoside hydrolase family 47 protein [Pseudoxanthomonas sp.]|nr:glycoside hydrolase family 47 protein [Pseudoxanthomonas sp.]